MIVELLNRVALLKRLINNREFKLKTIFDEMGKSFDLNKIKSDKYIANLKTKKSKANRIAKYYNELCDLIEKEENLSKKLNSKMFV